MKNEYSDQGTAYMVLADCLELSHLKDNIFLSPDNKRYVLTKYGFYPDEVYNMTMEKDEQKKAYNYMLLEKHHEIKHLKEELEKATNRLNELEPLIPAMKEKIRVHEWRTPEQIDDDELRNAKEAFIQLQRMYDKLLQGKLHNTDRIGAKTKTGIMNIINTDLPDAVKLQHIRDYLAGLSPVFMAQSYIETE